MIADQQFVNFLYADPSGTRKSSNNTIFDEIRHATQHSQKPLEQVLQMISELHGGWTGTNQNTANLLIALLSLFSNKQNKNIRSQIQQGLQILQTLKSTSVIGRQNDITANQMDIPLLRQFISKSQAVHPSVNAYIQNNIGKYPYFQPVSEQIGSLGQVVLTSKDIHPIKRIEIGGKDNMQTDSPIRRNVDQKLFKNVSTLIDQTDALVNCLFLRAMKPEGNNTILLDSNNTRSSHGYSYTTDVANADRNKKAVAPCLAEAVQRFGPAIQLLDSFFPIQYQVKLEPQLFEIETETGLAYVDKLNRPLVRELPTPVAKDENVVQTA